MTRPAAVPASIVLIGLPWLALLGYGTLWLIEDRKGFDFSTLAGLVLHLVIMAAVFGGLLGGSPAVVHNAPVVVSVFGVVGLALATLTFSWTAIDVGLGLAPLVGFLLGATPLRVHLAVAAVLVCTGYLAIALIVEDSVVREPSGIAVVAGAMSLLVAGTLLHRRDVMSWVAR